MDKSRYDGCSLIAADPFPRDRLGDIDKVENNMPLWPNFKNKGLPPTCPASRTAQSIASKPV